MQLPAHPTAVRTGIPYERVQGNQFPNATLWGAPTTLRKENGFYEALASAYCLLHFDNLTTVGAPAANGARSALLEGVEAALRDHNLPNPVMDASVDRQASPKMIAAVAETLRTCLAMHLAAHFDALFTSSPAAKDGRDSLYEMYDALHPEWRTALRHTEDSEPEQAEDPYNVGKERLLSAARMYIQQRASSAKERFEASRLEASIAADVFCAFIYLHKGDADGSAVERIYGPDAETLTKWTALTSVHVLTDGKGSYRKRVDTGSDEAVGGALKPVVGGNESGDVERAIRARVSVVGGLTPLRFAQGYTTGNAATIGLMRRGAAHLRRPGEPDERWRDAHRDAPVSERSERRKAARDGYPPPRTSEAAPFAAKGDVWTWDALMSDDKRDADQRRAIQKITAYGVRQDQQQLQLAKATEDPGKRERSLRAQNRPKPVHVTSWWELRNLMTPNGATYTYMKAANQIAKEVWQETHVSRPPPAYKRWISDRDDGEIEQLAKRRALVNRWIRGHMCRPKLPDGTEAISADGQDEADVLRCQANENFTNNCRIQENHALNAHMLLLLDASKRNALEGDYADFMAAERRLLMNVLKRVPRDGHVQAGDLPAALEAAYEADAASFATRPSERKRQAAATPSPSLANSGGKRAEELEWLPSAFERTLRPDGLDEAAEPPAPWEGGKGVYAASEAARLIGEVKASLKNGDSDARFKALGSLQGRGHASLRKHVGKTRHQAMPPTEDPRRNAALVRYMQLLKQIQHPQLAYLDTTNKEDQWRCRDHWIADPLIGRPNGTKTPLVRYENSEFVNLGETILAQLLRRYKEYSDEHRDAFVRDDLPMQRLWDLWNMTKSKSSGSDLTGKKMERALYTVLLRYYPKDHRDDSDVCINPVMKFIGWYHTHVWKQWTYDEGTKRFDKTNARSRFCQFVGAPDVTTWEAPKKQLGWEHELRKKLLELIDTLSIAVAFAKRALDFAVVDEKSPLKQTNELRAVLQGWEGMTTGKALPTGSSSGTLPPRA